MTPDNDLDGGAADVTSLDWTDYESAATAVAEAVAAATDREPSELTPLQYAVDADALDRLLGNEAPDDLVVTFTYENRTVRVGDGTVEVSQ
jgi:hypothetical protein